MTIKTIINDGNVTSFVIYRNIYKLRYSDFMAGFMAQSSINRWGEMWQLKGKERILLARFGVKK